MPVAATATVTTTATADCNGFTVRPQFGKELVALLPRLSWQDAVLGRR